MKPKRLWKSAGVRESILRMETKEPGSAPARLDDPIIFLPESGKPNVAASMDRSVTTLLQQSTESLYQAVLNGPVGSRFRNILVIRSLECMSSRRKRHIDAQSGPGWEDLSQELCPSTKAQLMEGSGLGPLWASDSPTIIGLKSMTPRNPCSAC
uniref:Uncharacterized protein n=1 Tax=Coccidioides posadasii RMSCC 3488 TaxID=454284 RepID=A0A0J6FUY3_COCPO|nr:hypothetical protein CPAG_09524 [Coccidioides posadasii RMSCC 3488]